jgi:gas vesicle protein
MRFILGILIGAGIGAALGLIIAPQSGRETREALSKRVRAAAEHANDGIPDPDAVAVPVP